MVILLYYNYYFYLNKIKKTDWSLNTLVSYRPLIALAFSFHMPRAAWKGPFFKLSLLNQVNSLRKSSNITSSLPSSTAPTILNTNTTIQSNNNKTTARSSTILPQMVGVTLEVHNGRSFIPLTIREEMVGMKLGKLVACKKPFSFRQTNAGKKVKK